VGPLQTYAEAQGVCQIARTGISPRSQAPQIIKQFMHRSLISGLLLVASCATTQPNASANITSPASGQSADVAAIRAERTASNTAIARRDAAGTVAHAVPTYQVLPAGALVLSSRDSMYATLARQFADTAMLGYVRTPITVEVSATGPTAAEYGRWVGRRRRPDGVQETSGTYFAAWRRTPDGWRMQAETFVSLSCVGSSQCPVAR
jgi:ketosteroid isomerase-like protein